MRKARTEEHKKFKLAHPEQVRRWRLEYTKRWRSKNPEKHQAHRTVESALRKGELVRPEACDLCSKSCKPHAHHANYGKPLEVTWLCPDCHNVQHGRVPKHLHLKSTRARVA